MTNKPETETETIQRLTAELEAANKAIETFNAQKAQASSDELLIGEKMSVGLTREQAKAVIRRQREAAAIFGDIQTPTAKATV